MRPKRALLLISLMLLPLAVQASDNGITAVTVNQAADGSTSYNLSMKIMMAMTLMAFAPALLMAATAFTRVMIVFAILRQALGMPNIPTNQMLIGLSLFITLFIMSPVIQKVNDTALQPFLKHQLTEDKALSGAVKPFRQFMLKQTRVDDLNLFRKMAKVNKQQDIKDTSLFIIMPAFLTSELKTAFQMGFLMYLPFLIIDLVVASILMSMGMMMLSPLVISLPFKLLLFVMVDGWVLIIGTLASSFRV